MRIKKLFGIEGARQSKGITVIIDIFRAATVSAFLLEKNVKEIIPVSTKEEAFEYKRKNPSYILVGEEMGYKIKGFGYGNSPFEISKAKNLHGKIIVHRSSMGTQGIVNATKAAEIIFGSFVSASAIVNYLISHKNQEVSIVALDGPRTEDDVFAGYLIGELTGKERKNIKDIIKYLKQFPRASRFFDPKLPEFPKEDFYLCLDLDRFNFFPLVGKGRIIKKYPSYTLGV